MAAEDKEKQTTPRVSLRRRRAASEDEALALVNADPTGAITAKKGRPTPSRRDEEEAEEGGNFFTRTIRSFSEYVEGVGSEIKKVAWPNAQEIRRLTVIVLASLVVSALFLGAISLFFTELFRLGLDTPILLFGFMFVAIAGGFIYNRVNSRKTTTY